ncbi:aminoacyltransferase [Macrococcus hajekii]|uniref:Aminoacyltransferase n=1 Tax=Macrococcus hajekii TaxID=198482 RepID=A0A4R6BMU5_9STAP|nr:aminoacyltransferase [Macrococcus hajekii]TDM03058.1 aminoacyltransferase [Macrococcus hajekii]GGB06226.1 aminoacyltransferase FemB [Macrococcus hajekii]
MQFAELTAKEYREFMNSTPYMSHYFQMAENIDNREEEKSPVVLLGVKENGKVIAASLFSKIPTFGSYMYYSNRGPVLNINNQALIRFYFESLDKYLKKHQCLTVKIDPYWIYRTYDKDVNAKTEGNDELIELIQSLGYTHGGFTRGYSHTQVRWMSVLYLDAETPQSIMKQFDSQRKRNIKKAQKYGVKIRLLAEDEIDLFLDLYRETEERTGMIARDDEYFRRFKRHYGDKAIMPLAYIDLDEHISDLSAEQLDLETKHDQLMLADNKSEKQLKKLSDLDDQLKKIQQNILDMNELKKTDGSILNLASGMFFENNFEINYFSGGSSHKYSQFMGPYAMHWYMINYCFEHQFDRYNFYGVSGDFTENGEDYGVYRFKRGFNAQIEELVGDFTKTINKPKETLHQAVTKAGVGARKIKSLINRKK